MATQYLFTSERLGFRDWIETDIEKMAAINADTEVMEFFPGTQSYEQTAGFVTRMQRQMVEKGFCYFAVDTLHNGEFIGFIGLSEQTYEASFTPCIDVGWRLAQTHWGKGFATEGAKRCLQYAFLELSIKRVCAIAPKINVRSERIMKKIGMKKGSDFTHPLLQDNARLRECILYKMFRKEHMRSLI